MWELNDELTSLTLRRNQFDLSFQAIHERLYNRESLNH